MDLLAFISGIKVDGGIGGRAGTNGRGGYGGSGGQGGSSHSWTTSTSYTERDANGNTVTRWRTHYHSNPGGMPGLSGSCGRDGYAHLFNG